MEMSWSGVETGVEGMKVTPPTRMVRQVMVCFACAVAAAGTTMRVTAVLRTATAMRLRIASVTSASASLLSQFNDIRSFLERKEVPAGGGPIFELPCHASEATRCFSRCAPYRTRGYRRRELSGLFVFVQEAGQVGAFGLEEVLVFSELLE